MPDDANNPIFGEGTCRPGCPASSLKPVMRRIMTDMSRIEQGDQDVDVQ